MWRLKITNERQRVQITQLTNELYLGRAPENRPGAIRVDDPYVSRQQVHILRESDTSTRIENTGRAVVRIENGRQLSRGESGTLPLPVTFSMGHTNIVLSTVSRLTEPATIPVSTLRAELFEDVSGHLGEPPTNLTPSTVGRWFERLLAVHRSAAGSDAFYDETAAAVVELVGLDRGLVLLRDRKGWSVKSFCTIRGDDESGYSHSVVEQVLRNKRIVHDLPAGDVVTSSLQNVEAIVAAPILDDAEQVVGIIYGSRDVAGHGGAVQPLQAQFVQLLANAVGAGLVRAAQQRQLLQYEDELAIARRIQTSFLPAQTPVISGWQIACHFSPARDVSGDFYDLFSLPTGQYLAVAIADVCDKGVGAALFMAVVRTLVRAFSSHPSCYSEASSHIDVCRVVELVDRHLLDNHAMSNMFATLFFGLLETTTGHLCYVNAGHEPPIVVDNRGSLQRLAPTGPAVGIFNDAHFATGQVTLEPLDTLIAFTDGITEARDFDGGFFGAPRLAELVRAHHTADAYGLVSTVMQHVREHLAAIPQSDDIAVISLKRNPAVRS